MSVTTANNNSTKDKTTDRPPVSPDVNIFETKDAFVLEAEMAGVNKEGLEITLDGNVLTFVGRRQDTTPATGVLYRESRQADYRRVFELDPSIDTSRISAKMDQGILVLTLPKVERAKPRSVVVN